MTNGYLFREYIGAQFKSVRFSDVPINPGLSFNFILAFAIDYTPVNQQATPTPTNGVFSAFWDTANLSRADVAAIKAAHPNVSVMRDTANLSRADVAAIKAAHPNVSVMLGIGGDSVQDIVKLLFTPTSVDSWVANAVASLSALITEYGLDGVDVDYERFADGVSVDTFVECIGRLLTQLKARFPNLTTSIAPFEDDIVQKNYKPLWSKYSSIIDYVNFQFYAYGANTDVPSLPTYVKFYNDQQANYAGAKVLASFKTGDVTGLLSPEQGISGAQELLRQNKLPGLFIFSADSSKIESYRFEYETRAQEIVANH